MFSTGFKMSNFVFSDVDPSLFCQFQWKIPGQPVSFLVYRLLFALYQVAWNLTIIVIWGDSRFYRPVDSKWKWPIYASNWALFTFSCYTVAAFLTALNLAKRHEVRTTHDSQQGNIDLEIPNDHHASKIKEVSPPVPWFVKVTWFLQVTSYSASLFVSVAYWLIDFDPEVEQASIFTLHTHAFSSVMVLIDIFLVAAPLNLGHFIHASAFGLTYFSFTFVYYLLGGHNPYGETSLYDPLVDWESSPLLTLLAVIVISLIVVPIFHIFLFGSYKLRTIIHRKVN